MQHGTDQLGEKKKSASGNLILNIIKFDCTKDKVDLQDERHSDADDAGQQGREPHWKNHTSPVGGLGKTRRVKISVAEAHRTALSS